VVRLRYRLTIVGGGAAVSSEMVSRSTGWAVDVGCVKVIDELVNAIGLILFRDLFYVLLSIYWRELVP
jgi:hypothetical protein